MLNPTNWRRYSGTFSFSENDPIDEVIIEIVGEDSVISNDEHPTGNLPIYFTDIHFQPGNKLTGWVPETREFYKKLYHTNKETKTRVSVDDIYLGGKTPVDRTNLEFREYNITGRGIEVFTVPNWYPDDWHKEVLPTALDLEITPKNDYDFCRICTNAGSLKGEEDLYDNDPDHPLSMNYTREFALGAGSAGVPIKITASTGKAYRGSTRLLVGGINTVSFDPVYNHPGLPIKKRSFFLAQKGAIRIRIEFYKMVSRGTGAGGLPIYALKDTGIGYYGTAKFNQWTYGRSRV